MQRETVGPIEQFLAAFSGESGGSFPEVFAGVERSAQLFLAAALHVRDGGTMVVVAPDSKSQERAHQDFSTWLRIHRTEGKKASGDGEGEPLFFPAWDVPPHTGKLPHVDVISERLETLIALGEAKRSGAGDGLRDGKLGGGRCVVTHAEALVHKSFSPKWLAARTRVLRPGDTCNPLDLIEWLEEQGYEPEVQVSGKGELAWRGGIVDAFPPSRPWPVRLEFFGDELESIREFDPRTQMSTGSLEQVELSPAGELSLLRKVVGGEVSASAAAEGKPSVAGDGGDAAISSILAHLPAGATIVLLDPEECAANAKRAWEDSAAGGREYLESWEELLAGVERGGFRCVRLASSAVAEQSEVGPPRKEAVLFTSMEAHRAVGASMPEPAVAEAQRRNFFHQMFRWKRQGTEVHVFFNNVGERDRFLELWKEYGGGVEAPAPRLHLGALSGGFLCEAAKLVVVTDAEIFGRYKVQRPRRLKSPHAASVRSAFEVDFTEFEEGDLVVHLEHGIGRYRGLQTKDEGKGQRPSERGGAGRGAGEAGGAEYLVIEYAPGAQGGDGPKLYVPVTEAHLVSKYVGAGKAQPPLSQLGGTRWTKAKQQAERAVQDLAGELLKVQAARAVQAGHAFAPDTPWQREFESAFLYEETGDQLRAIEATKRDMESLRPMDRLICGDVGFGKTEVALRAAFKAVMGGKQVAILVPTTVLAQQHYNNFRERLADYPIRVEVLSRFRSARQQREILEAARNGGVDILIGTHRLIQPDMEFKDLGLVVVDEEQRFGVKHKERFKLLRSTVDVLTLSATPIPRTLYLALTGARDLSTLETPPQDRLPIETVVTSYDERLIRDAILREMHRGGQVYFLHNRVTTIDGMAMRLRALVPDARIVVGHGQMDADELEKVMLTFVNGEADILVSTTIIESGLDIPNANTIIIDRADRFGLSELYQLRGRVGRYRHQAYAYLMLPRHANLLTEARKRMSAIKQYSALGSGFKIAMRDLEIRGAGNMLGAEQSGHITAVGFDLYCQLLKQSIAANKGEKVQARVDVRLRLDFLAMNPGEEGRTWATQISASLLKRRKERETRSGLDHVEIPREVATFRDDTYEYGAEDAPEPAMEQRPKTPAYLPMDYVREPELRLEIYRRLAQVTDKSAVEALRKEMTDRFGTPPESVELMLALAELKVLAAERGISAIDVAEDKVKLTRNGQLMSVGGKFPRLTKRDARGRIGELKRLLLSMVAA